MTPLLLRLKRQSQKDIAKAQDLIVDVLYSLFNDAVFHGGTCIWRCYQGNRFSEDIDVYIPRDLQKLDLFFDTLKQRGFMIKKRKIGENSLYSNLQFDRIFVRFKVLFKKIPGHLKEYETAEGNIITVLALSAEELISEKVQTYLQRRKIRDLYDIFFLLKFIPEKDTVKKELKKLIEGYKDPIDEENLKVIILEGLVPSAEKMKEYISRECCNVLSK